MMLVRFCCNAKMFRHIRFTPNVLIFCQGGAHQAGSTCEQEEPRYGQCPVGQEQRLVRICSTDLDVLHVLDEDGGQESWDSQKQKAIGRRRSKHAREAVKRGSGRRAAAGGRRAITHSRIDWFMASSTLESPLLSDISRGSVSTAAAPHM